MNQPAPRISVVTPSFNQGAFLEETLRSVLDPGYPNLEYIVMDGGSTDASANIIRKHASRITYWVSEKDQGQYGAINKGFARSTGEIMAWLNSDDKYLPWTLSIAGEIFASRPEVEWISSCYPLFWDEAGRAVSCGYFDGFHRAAFFRGEYMSDMPWPTRSWIMQEATFWRRSLWERAGGRLDPNVEIAADFELWARFYGHAELYGVGVPLAGFRHHHTQKTAGQIETYRREAEDILRRHGGKPPSPLRSWWLRKRFRLLTWFARKQGCGFGPRPHRHLVLHGGRAGGWTIKR